VKDIKRIGMDTSKSVFQLHGVDGNEQPVLRKKLRRKDMLTFLGTLSPTKIGIEACGAAHHWARELALLGHEVVLIPPQYVKPYVDRGKNDAADAEAICEAMSRPKIQKRFVPVKSAEQQAAQMLMGARDGLIRRRTQLTNAIRGHAAEFGLIAAKGLDKIEPLLLRIAQDETVPALARALFATQSRELIQLRKQIAEIDAQVMSWHRGNELSRRLVAVPTIGPITACLLVMKTPQPGGFRSGRDFAAWIGLTPKDHSTAGKVRMGGITRAGDEVLRKTLVVGATALIQQVRRGRSKPSPWLAAIIARKPPKLAAVALANKTARTAWKLMTSGERYNADHRPTSAPSRAGRCASLVGGSAARPALSRSNPQQGKEAPMNA
jgi:transposase